MAPIRLALQGATGNMGQELLRALPREKDLELVGLVAVEEKPDLPPGWTGTYSTSVEEVLEKARPQVFLDFSIAEATRTLYRAACPRKVPLVIGTSGLTPQDLEEIDRLARSAGVGAVVAPNFALGAVVMNYLARLAAPFFDYAEIVEMHHHGKVDAPSGTALATARAMVAARGRPFSYPVTKKENIPGTRGGELGGVAIHSMRLPGLMAHQEVVLGTAGQTLRIRHDTLSRECYLPGILMAIRRVMELRGLVHGLEALLGLEGSKA